MNKILTPRVIVRYSRMNRIVCQSEDTILIEILNAVIFSLSFTLQRTYELFLYSSVAILDKDRINHFGFRMFSNARNEA